MKSNVVLAWHFLPALGQLSNGDKRPVVVGETLKHSGKVCICESGLHASVDILDALSYRVGPVLCRVEVWGDLQKLPDKVCGRFRRCLSMRDVTHQLQEFALLCAEHVLPVFEKHFPEDRRARNCLEVTRRYLAGKATAEELSSARTVARTAADASVAAHVADAADAAYAAAYAADAADASVAAHVAAAAADAAADAAYAADSRNAERAWQRQTLANLVST